MAGCAAVLLLAFTGCGGGDGGATAVPTAALTKVELLKKGNTICRRGNDEIRANEARFLKEHRSDDVRGAMENVLPVRKKELRLLRRLGTPAEGAKRLEAMLDGMEEGIERAEQNPHSLLAARPEYAFSKAYVIGMDYGLVKCWLG